MEDIKDYILRLRNDFTKYSLDEKTVDPDPVIQFGNWFRQAMESRIHEPNAMVLSTATNEGKPSGRVVLLRDFSHSGFSFFTNYNSRKSRDMEENPFAALTFYWPELERQIRIEGKIIKVAAEESDAYFASRPKGSQVGAHISPQSEKIESREYLEKLHQELMSKYQESEISRPPFWGGFRIVPDLYEFWQGRASRLHDRIEFRQVMGIWERHRLAP